MVLGEQRREVGGGRCVPRGVAGWPQDGLLAEPDLLLNPQPEADAHADILADAEPDCNVWDAHSEPNILRVSVAHPEQRSHAERQPHGHANCEPDAQRDQYDERLPQSACISLANGERGSDAVRNVDDVERNYCDAFRHAQHNADVLGHSVSLAQRINDGEHVAIPVTVDIGLGESGRVSERLPQWHEDPLADC